MIIYFVFIALYIKEREREKNLKLLVFKRKRRNIFELKEKGERKCVWAGHFWIICAVAV